MTAVSDEQQPAERSTAGSAVRYRKRWDKGCRVTAKERDRIQDAIDLLPVVARRQMQIGDDQRRLDVEPLAGARVKDMWRLKLPPFRVIFVPANDEVLVLQLERRHDHSYDNVDDLDRFVLTRRGEGVQVVEVTKPASSVVSRGREPARKRRASLPDRDNPLTPFDGGMLTKLGLDRGTIKRIRTLSESIDIAEELAGLGLAPDVVELVGDVWHDPERYLAIFDSGRVPIVEDARIDEDELAARLRSVDSSSAVAALDRQAFEAALAGSIEEWMFYLHPSQAEIVQHVTTGPMRVQGGPGTGKTVAALHRARYLVRSGQAGSLLLTTFVNLLPGVWKNLLRTFAPDVQGAVTTRTVDALALEIVTEADDKPGAILGNGSDERRKLLGRVLRKTPGLSAAIGTASNFEREIDQVIAGRDLDLDGYLGVERRGRGTRLRVAERQVVWAGYERYRTALREENLVDWATLRVRALELARHGAGPRFDAVIVDEAQDLTAAQLMLLLELDTSPDHSGFMLVGDGRQAIYPGGYRLAHVGLSARRQPFKLETNWRNTQWIAEAAQAALGETEFADLETGELAPSSAEQPLPLRLGEPVELHVVSGSHDGAEVMLMLVDDALWSGTLADIAVVGRTKRTLDWAEKTLRDAGRAVVRLDDYKGQPVDAIRVGTFAKSKGLEFKLVVIAAAGKDSWAVSPHWLRDDSEIDEWWATELRTFYVAMTRARDRLAILTGPDLSPPIERARDLLDEQDWR